MLAPIPSFTIHTDAFNGTLTQAIQALRSGKLSPQQLNVLAVVQAYLEYYQHYAASQLETTSQSLSQLAALIELKTRLLLPQPASNIHSEEETVVTILQDLAALDDAISFLRQRQQQRQGIVPAQLPAPRAPKPRPQATPTPKPSQAKRRLQRLRQLAARYQTPDYFSLSHERLTMPMARQALLTRLKQLGRAYFAQLSPKHWRDQVVYFAALLEMIKTRSVTGEQLEPFAPITLHPVSAQKNAPSQNAPS